MKNSGPLLVLEATIKNSQPGAGLVGAVMRKESRPSYPKLCSVCQHKGYAVQARVHFLSQIKRSN